MHVVVVRSCQDFVAFAQWQSVVEQSQTGRGILGKRDVLRDATNVAGDGTADLQGDVLVSRFENRVVNCNKRISIDLLPVLLDRLSHRPGMRRQKEQREMNVISSQF